MTGSGNEIDLVELFAKIVRFLANNIVAFVSAFIVGSILGLAYYQYTANVYESEMILLSDILTPSYAERLTENFKKIIGEGNDSILSERLGISREEAGWLRKIEIEDITKAKGASTSPNEGSLFLVTADVSNTSLYPKLQDGFINYLRRNEFVKIRVDQRQNLNKTMIERVTHELNSLDSLKKRLFLGQPVYAKNGETMLMDPSSIYNTIVTLNKSLVEYQTSLTLVNSIQLVEGFTVLQKPISPMVSVSIAGGISVGFLFVGLVLIFKSIRKILRFLDAKLEKN